MEISFIIQTNNSVDSIVPTLQALNALRQLQYEIIVTDNGSSDFTGALVRSLAHKVIVRSADVPMTKSECYNRGAKAATGDLLWFIESTTRIIDLETTADEVVHHFQRRRATVALTLNSALNWQKFIQNFFRPTQAIAQCLIVRRSAFEHAKGFNVALPAGEIIDLWQRLKMLGDTKILWHRQVVPLVTKSSALTTESPQV